MEISKNYLKKFKVIDISAERSLADEIYQYFGKPKKSYFIIYNNIKLRGVQWCREKFEELKKYDYSKTLAYWIGMIKTAKTIWWK